MQIHNKDTGASATMLMLYIYDGKLRLYSGRPMADNISDRCLQLNMVHNIGLSTMTVYIAGEDVKPTESSSSCTCTRAASRRFQQHGIAMEECHRLHKPY
ncbi:hypothetical protein PR202_gb00438 [Eleusine coracana subsp. coracana]|uniref:Uncharacterized protein n=1 Tax=Eleusine coracana subsp. coracana TaxID=191504 RepID=A0AAV5DTR7_ELECO|nr:hypothetical protein PR202_gb00438 [Eleusine coracana subsp. coracana]